MGTYGTISECVFETESFTEWSERLEQWFIANTVEDEKKRSVFLTCIGARGYKLISSLAQNKPTEHSYEQLKEMMLNHLHPRPNEITQRYIFYKRDGKAG